MTATMPGMRMPDGSHAIAVPVVPVTESGDYAAVEAKNAVFSAYAKTGISATAYAILIDLSDTVNWPHKGTSYAAREFPWPGYGNTGRGRRDRHV